MAYIDPSPAIAPRRVRPRPPRIFAGLLGLIGLFLMAGGVWLLVLGGSFYYELAGAAILGSAILLWQGKALGSAIFQLTAMATVLWALWEGGFDVWAVTPRIALFLVLTAWLYTPWVRRGLQSNEPDDDNERLAERALPKNATAGIALALLGSAAFLGVHQLQAQENASAGDGAPSTEDGDWSHAANTLAGANYTGLSGIDESNVGRLERAWTYRSGDTPAENDAPLFPVTPIEIADTLYFCTPHGDMVALDAASGEERWRFAAGETGETSGGELCSGVAYHTIPNANGVCAAKIVGTLGTKLFALDATTGQPCTGFGENGIVALNSTAGLPLIAGEHILVGAARPTGEDEIKVSALSVRDGTQEWTWGGDGAFAVTAPFSADTELGLLYVATGAPELRTDGSAPSAFEQRFSNAVVALDLERGTPQWEFQTAHNDVWNYGLSAQPVLVDLPIPGGVARALAQATKQGDVFVLDRESGEAMKAFAETPVPAGAGLSLSATQPRSEIAFLSEPLTEKDMWGFTPLDQLVCHIWFQRARYDGPFTPPGSQASITYPGAWSARNGNGIAVDMRNKLIVANTSAVATYDRIVATEDGRYEKVSEPFVGPLGAPCNEPPWGFLHLFDLKTTEPAWSEAIGSARNSGPFGMPLLISATIGTPNLGGSLVTGGSVIFSAATADGRIAAYHLFTGEELWSARLPAGGQTTPMTYESQRRQFVVVAASGNRELGTPSGDYIVAYALPGT